MSRSHRKTPITGNTTADSEKQAKRYANRAYRKRVRDAIQSGAPLDILPLMLEVASCWWFDKDCKHWIRNPLARWMRK